MTQTTPTNGQPVSDPQRDDREALRDLLERWERQQDVYVADRDNGFATICDVLDALGTAPIAVLDLAAGPGSLSRRIIERVHNAQCVAVDADPVLQTIGEQALGDLDGRLGWVEADLRDPDWSTRLGGRHFDAVVSSTALHWLEPAHLRAVYRAAASLLRPGGVLLNFDRLPSEHTTPLTKTADRIDRHQQLAAMSAGADGWQQWWDRAREHPSLAQQFSRRDQIFAPPQGSVFGRERARRATLQDHANALRAAGLDDAEVIWQRFDRKIVAAIHR